MDIKNPSSLSGNSEIERKVNDLSEQLAKLLEVVKIDGTGSVLIKSKNRLELKSGSNISLNAPTGIDISAGSNVQVKGATINLN
jgi:hypothetical protein